MQAFLLLMIVFGLFFSGINFFGKDDEAQEPTIQFQQSPSPSTTASPTPTPTTSSIVR